MKSSFARAAVACASILSTNAFATPPSPPLGAENGNPGGCPIAATAATDGCGIANFNATTLIPNFFNGYATQSGQGAYATRPNWNVAGVDYPVGFHTPLNQMIDVRTTPPAGCHLRTLGASVALQCNGSGPLLISGYRFDLQGGTFLYVTGAYTSIQIDDCYFLNGTTSDRLGGALVVIAGGSGDLTVTSSTFDGAGRTRAKGLFYLIEDVRTGAQRDIITHNAIFRVPQKGIGTGPCGDTTIQHNYFEEMELSPSHGDFTIDGNTLCVKNNLVESYNTALITSGLVRTGAGGITALFFLSAGNPLRSWNTVVTSHNTLVSNTIGSPSVAPGAGAATVSRMIEQGGGSVYTVMEYSNNYIDPTGSLLCYYVPTPTPAATIMQNNVNLLDGSGVNDFTQQSCYGHHP